MLQPPREVVVRAHGEVRGTQSFVQVMATVFRRPGLLWMEVAWRWIIGLIFLGLVALENREASAHLVDVAYWRSLGFALAHGAYIFSMNLAGLLTVAVALVVWAAISGLARSAILCKLEPTLDPRRATVVVLTLLRVLAFSILVAAWFWALVSIWSAVSHNSDPNYVAGFAAIVVCTLALFMLWSVSSWIFPLAITLAMERDLGVRRSLRAAAASKKMRSKLIEINLVMGIVKIALVVLAMVFSATPLPFQSFTTDTFLWSWWVGVALLYLVASDFFHVVRMAACLALTRSMTEN